MSSAASSLQLAQVLADLSTLQNTVGPPSFLFSAIPLIYVQDPDAAHALLRANKTLAASRSQSRKARPSAPPDGVEFDYLGRRIKTPKKPAFSRQGSSMSGSGSFSRTVSPGASIEVRPAVPRG